MKALLILLLLPIGLSAQVTTKTDEFTGKTTLLGTVAPAENSAGHTSNMVAMRLDGATYIILVVISHTWVHLSDNTVHALSGESKARVNVTMLKVSQDTGWIGNSLQTEETIAIRLPTHTLNNPFLIRIGSVVYTVPPSVVADVRTIGGRL